MSIRLSSYLAAFLFLLCADTCVAQLTLTVAAASDLSAIGPTLASYFEKENQNVRVRFVNGASAMLAQQIENGAPFDVFLSANAQFVDQLAAKGKLDPATVRSYATGRLAVLWRDKKSHPLSYLADDSIHFLALPNPKLAPYGVAAEQALQHAGAWSAAKPKVVYGENVRQTLQLFDSGNADAVITADSLLQGRGAEPIPQDWHAPIIQKGGTVAASKQQTAGKTFLDWLIGPSGQAIFAKYGFGRPTP
jgi:molybdate transport system substrate-binding protein